MNLFRSNQEKETAESRVHRGRTLSQTTTCDDLKHKFSQLVSRADANAPKNKPPTNTHTHTHTHRACRRQSTNKHPCKETPMFSVLSTVCVCLKMHPHVPSTASRRETDWRLVRRQRSQRPFSSRNSFLR